MWSWWDVFQAVADGISIVPSWLWLIRNRSTVTSPKIVLKVKGRVPRLDAGTAFAMPLLQDQFLVGLLHEHLEEPALGFQTGLMNVGLDLVGEMLILLRYGQAYLKRRFERECLAVTVDGADRDGSLKAVGGTHGVSPYCTGTMGVHPACFLSIR